MPIRQRLTLFNNIPQMQEEHLQCWSTHSLLLQQVTHQTDQMLVLMQMLIIKVNLEIKDNKLQHQQELISSVFTVGSYGLPGEYLVFSK